MRRELKRKIGLTTLVVNVITVLSLSAYGVYKYYNRFENNSYNVIETNEPNKSLEYKVTNLE